MQFNLINFPLSKSAYLYGSILLSGCFKQQSQAQKKQSVDARCFEDPSKTCNRLLAF